MPATRGIKNERGRFPSQQLCRGAGEGSTFPEAVLSGEASGRAHGTLLQPSGLTPARQKAPLRYLIRNTVFSFPLQKDVLIEGRGQPVPRGVVVHVDIPCSQQAPASGESPPANAMLGAASKEL